MVLGAILGDFFPIAVILIAIRGTDVIEEKTIDQTHLSQENLAMNLPTKPSFSTGKVGFTQFQRCLN
jgi:hypothetical protein